jgi:hypothetical protein
VVMQSFPYFRYEQYRPGGRVGKRGRTEQKVAPSKSICPVRNSPNQPPKTLP